MSEKYKYPGWMVDAGFGKFEVRDPSKASRRMRNIRFEKGVLSHRAPVTTLGPGGVILKKKPRRKVKVLEKKIEERREKSGNVNINTLLRELEK